MDVIGRIKRHGRRWRHHGVSALLRALLWGFAIAVLLALGQGLYELYDPERGLTESLGGINWTWGVACILTVLGVLITSGAVWRLAIGAKAADARLLGALKIVVRSLDLGESANVRATVYIAAKAKRGVRILYQEFPYVYAHRPGKDYGMGRQGIQESVGIVGHVFRLGSEAEEGLTAFVPNATPEDFTAGLTKPPWNFPEQLAKQIDSARASYMTFRFSRQCGLGKPPLEGVLFFDARGSEQQFDDDIAARLCRGQLDIITDYIVEAYGGGTIA